MIKLTESEYQGVCEIVRKFTGIHLGPNKQYLVETRLQALLRQENWKSFSDLIFQARYATERIKTAIIEAMTTGETLFFRDQAPFDWFKEELLRWEKEGNGQVLRIWSCACSTGQELWSLAMTIAELNRTLSFPIRILGTDINKQSLEKAKLAIYSDMEVARGIDPTRLQRHFEPAGAGQWRIKDSLRKYVEVSPANLFEDNVQLGLFNLIFCRNVAIYFEEDDKQILWQKLHGHLSKEGALIIGSTESIYANPLWQPVSAGRLSLYRKA